MPYKNPSEHREKLRENTARYRSRNTEKVLEIGRISDRKRYEKRRSYSKEYLLNYQRRNKEKVRGYHIKYKYGITLEQYNDLFKKQKGMCAVCGRHQNEIGRTLAVEHCHKTERVRGLVCQRCNLAIGVLENKELCLKVTLFLEESR